MLHYMAFNTFNFRNSLHKAKKLEKLYIFFIVLMEAAAMVELANVDHLAVLKEPHPKGHMIVEIQIGTDDMASNARYSMEWWDVCEIIIKLK